MNLSFIRLFVGIGSRLILIVDFEGKVYKRFGVEKVKDGVFHVVESIT